MLADKSGASATEGQGSRQLPAAGGRPEGRLEPPPLQEVIDRLPAMVGYWDRDLRNRVANAAYLDWFGRTPERMFGAPLREVLGSEPFERYRPHVAAALAGREQVFDRTLTDASGRVRHSQVSYVPDVADGEVLGFHVLVTDITARVEAEARTRRSAEEFRSLVRSIPGGFVLLFDGEMRFKVADGEALAVFGYTPERIEGQTIHEAFPPALAEELEPRYRAALAGRSTSWDRVLGDAVYHLTAGPVRGGDGEVFAGTVVCIDVTAARRSAAVERALSAIAALVARNSSVREVVALVAERLLDVFGLDTAMVVRLEDGERADVLAVEPPRAAAYAEVSIAAGDGTAVGRLMSSGEAAAVRYGEGDAAGARALYDSGLRSSAAAPVRVGGRLWGAVAVGSTKTTAIDGAMLARLCSFAELVALAITNAQSWAELSRRATHDGITELPNHRSFHDHLAREVAQAHRYGHGLALAMLDIDRFKAINDEHGHPAGDRVLAELARRLGRAVRGNDILARVGGEEFAVLMPQTSVDEGMAVAERIRAAIAGATFPEVGTVTVSVGVSGLADAPHPAILVSSADQALYDAKRRGRNRCVRHRLGGSPQEA